MELGQKRNQIFCHPENHHYFRRKETAVSETAVSKQHKRIGSWWDRKGENEIDIIAENEIDRTAVFFEVKRKSGNIDLEILRRKAEAFLRSTGEFNGYSISYKGLSMDDI